MRSLAIHLSTIIIAALLSSGFTLNAHSADTLNLKEQRSLLSKIDKKLSTSNLSAQEIDDLLLAVDKSRNTMSACIQNNLLEVAKRKAKKDTFSPQGVDNSDLSSALKGELKQVEADLNLAQNQLLDCQLLYNRGTALNSTLTANRGKLIYSRVRTRSHNAIDVIKTAYTERTNLLQTTSSLISNQFSGVSQELRQSQPWFFIGSFTVLLGIYWRFHGAGNALSNSVDTTSSKFNRFKLSLQEALRRYALLLLPLSAISIHWLTTNQKVMASGTLFVSQLCYLLTGFVCLFVLLRTILLPAKEQWAFVPIETRGRVALARRLRLLLFLLVSAYILQLVDSHLSLPEVLVNLLHLFIRVAVALNLIWLIWLIDRFERLKNHGRWLRSLLLIILLAILVAELFGFLELSSYLIDGFIGTLAAITVLWLLNEFTLEIFDGLDSGKRQWQQSIRLRLSIADGQHVPGLTWFKILASLLNWSLATGIFLRAWDLSEISSAWIEKLFFEGISVGQTQIVPLKLVLGVVIFATVLLLSNVLKSSLGRSSMLMSQLEPSARETVATLTGYAGFIFALLIGLSLAGFNFQNLAIVAGALSVGIGFGLQNVVNNFVSGLILLFERPIRKGDWVIVGGTEGLVKKIKVRSTEIQTFDRADIIVPNSEFISSQVTNWTLNDSCGRIEVAVGVAYGSDTGAVKEILLKLANEHDQILKAANYQNIPEPQVLFTAFGDSSLNFELRCFVHDVRKWPVVRSDLNFAIDKAFREAKIAIPFPQRDVHIIKPEG